MFFADIHNHILFGVDDGARTENEMYRMLDASYADGVRYLCFTPHYHPGYFGEHSAQIVVSFELAKRYVQRVYPDMMLYLGNELRYAYSFTEWLEQGSCRTLNDTMYVLVDFLYPERPETILDAMLRVLNAGYTPVLAHVERYEKFHRDLREIDRLKDWGVILQVDAQSPIGGLGHGSKVRARRLLEAGAADLIASDAHDLTRRPPQLRACFEFISRKYGEDYAQHLFWEEPMRILRTDAIDSPTPDQ